MKNILIIFILLLSASCEDFSLLERDQENVFFYENIIENKNSTGNLRVATFNINLGFCSTCNPFNGDIGGDFEHLDKIINLINSLNFDIISLQEVAHNYDATVIKNQIKYIAARTNMNYAYGMNRAIQTGSNLHLSGIVGNAVLSKYEIVSVENPVIRYIDYYNQNHCLNVRIKLNPNKEIIILNSHLQARSTNEEKEIQIRNIINENTNSNIPIILSGDFNINYTPQNYFLSLLNEQFHNSLDIISDSERLEVLKNGTYINGSTLDYLFLSKNNFKIYSGYIVPLEFRNISDHFAYIIDISLLEK